MGYPSSTATKHTEPTQSIILQVKCHIPAWKALEQSILGSVPATCTKRGAQATYLDILACLWALHSWKVLHRPKHMIATSYIHIPLGANEGFKRILRSRDY